MIVSLFSIYPSLICAMRVLGQRRRCTAIGCWAKQCEFALAFIVSEITVALTGGIEYSMFLFHVEMFHENV